MPAVLGFLKPGILIPNTSITTSENDTLNSLVNRMTQPGAPVLALGSVIATVAGVANLLNPLSLVIPLPAAVQASIEVTASLQLPIAPLTTALSIARNPQWVNQDFSGVAPVSTATAPIAPFAAGADPNSPLTLVQFAQSFNAALPGLFIGTSKLDTAAGTSEPPKSGL